MAGSPLKRSLTRPEFLDDASRELERHTAYERAEQDLEREILGVRAKRFKEIEEDLGMLLQKCGRDHSQTVPSADINERDKNDRHEEIAMQK